MTRHERFKYVSEIAKNADGMNNVETAKFHYYNPNGLVAKKQKNDDLVSELVEQGRARTGALYAHGTLNSYNFDNFRRMARLQRVNTTRLMVAIKMIENDIEMQEDFLKRMGAI